MVNPINEQRPLDSAVIAGGSALYYELGQLAAGAGLVDGRAAVADVPASIATGDDGNMLRARGRPEIWVDRQGSGRDYLLAHRRR